MADYRFSAKVIKRSNGQSAVAAAAYRAASNLRDERTGQTCDYSRKEGVTHCQVLAPEGTPEWMHDRAQLWNAVEAVERRKDAQLAREIQLSLPHELTDEQRRELVLGFAQEQFVNHGMIADVAIHAPSTDGDQRNHHAHVMLTMRELTGEGFGKKVRDWNSPDQLAQWREKWAHHQNRELERHGHEARVDHRSFEAQGVDREPTQHLGPVANDMERNGKPSRIGDENREVRSINTERVADHVELALAMSAVDHQKARLNQWGDRKRKDLEAARDLSKLDLSQKHHRQSQALENQIEEIYGTARRTVKAELQSVEKRLEAKGIRKALRSVFGKTRTDQTARADLSATLKNIEGRENEQRQALEQRQDSERRKEARAGARKRDGLEKGIKTAKERREAEGWTPTSPRGSKRGTERVGRPDRAKKPEAAPKPEPHLTPPTPFSKRPAKTVPKSHVPKSRSTAKKTTSRPAQASTAPIKGRFGKEAEPPEVKPSDAPTLADEKRATGHVLDEFKGDAKKPWQRASLSNENKRPWQRDDKPAGRERSPNDKPKEPKK